MPQAPGSRDGQRWLQAGAALAVAGTFSVFLGTYRQLLPGPWWLPLSLLIGVAIPGYVLGLLPLALLGFAEQYSDEDDHVLQPLPALALCILAGATIGVVLAGSILPITSA